MPFNTKMTAMLGIEHPIMQGGLNNLATPKLAAAVSNAGGLGTLNSGMYPDIAAFRNAVQELKSLTKKPFCVNVSILPDVKLEELTEGYIRATIEEGVKIIETSGRNPEPYIPMIKEAGMTLIHKVANIKLVKKAHQIGADMVSVVGYECGGHPGMDEVTTMVLANKACRVVPIPVIAGGGIVDGSSFLAALALGAEGVVMGTRLMATEECPLNQRFKEWILESDETSTTTIQRSVKNMLRVLKNDTAREALAMEQKGVTFEELFPVISGQRGRDAQARGDINGGVFSAGMAVGLIDKILPVAKVINSVIREAEEGLERLRGFGK